MKTIDVCIPTYRPGLCLRETVERLLAQRIPVRYIYLLNTEEKLFDSTLIYGYEDRVLVEHIPQMEFDHGYARDLMAKKSDADFLLFMTQDAGVMDRDLTKHLLAAFDKQGVAGAYARQIPYRDCNAVERLTRSFNYPVTSDIKGKDDEKRLGVKLYFCSNVCAMYRRDIYEQLGGFERGAIFNEDMVYAHRMISAGYRIAYCAKARVRHSHNYGLMQYFRRSFDMAISQAEHPEVFANVSSESEGSKMVWVVSRKLLSRLKVFSFISFGFSCVAKYLGYFLGKRYQHLPQSVVLWCTDSPWWFTQKEEKKGKVEING